MNVRAILLFAGGFAVFTVFVFIGAYYLYLGMQSRERGRDPQAESFVSATDEDVAHPLLQDGVENPGPVEEMIHLRGEEQKQLDEYAWIDRKAGTVRIPVARAMRLMAEKGFEHRETSESDPRIAMGDIPFEEEPSLELDMESMDRQANEPVGEEDHEN